MKKRVLTILLLVLTMIAAIALSSVEGFKNRGDTLKQKSAETDKDAEITVCTSK